MGSQNQKKHHKKLTARERDLIAVWKGRGSFFKRNCQKVQGATPTIVEEIRRNSFVDSGGKDTMSPSIPKPKPTKEWFRPEKDPS